MARGKTSERDAGAVTGGTASSGGALAAWGDASSGGTSTTGGAADSGGTSATGGVASSGGTVDAGGVASSGGTVDAGGVASSGGTVDAGVTIIPGPRIVIDDPKDGISLTDFPVRVTLDTTALINAGTLAADCSNLHIRGSQGCAQTFDFFLPAYSCNSASTELWVRAPNLIDGAQEVLEIAFDGDASVGSDGTRVFPFFDDFDGTALDATRWMELGSGSLTVSGGILESYSEKRLQSVSNVVSESQSIIGVRMAVIGELDTDVELGAGDIYTAPPTWAYNRDWDGVTFVGSFVAIYAFDGATGTSCDNMANGNVPTQLGATWADSPPGPATFLTAEFGYANVGDHAEAWFQTSRGASFQYVSPSGCPLPTTLPVLIVLDHNTNNPDTQYVDYVYVRPTTSSEPTTSVLMNSSLACGSTGP